MALDRQSIEKKDFPIARRGYDPEAVDAHLQRLAVEVQRLRGEATGASVHGTPPDGPLAATSPASIAIAASESVRAIVEAAESSAAAIEAAAREEAARFLADAQKAARDAREAGVAQSEGQVAAVGEATSLMLERVAAMEGEVGTLVQTLRTGTDRLASELAQLHGNVGELYDNAGSPATASTSSDTPAVTTVPAGEDAQVSAPDRPLPPIPEAAPDLSPHVEAPMVPPGLFVATDPPAADATTAAGDGPAAATPDGDSDVDGARLIALNMALNGASRDETDTYLRENFDLPDRAALVAEAFASVEG